MVSSATVKIERAVAEERSQCVVLDGTLQNPACSYAMHDCYVLRWPTASACYLENH
jgi:hypothetical protein